MKNDEKYEVSIFKRNKRKIMIVAIVVVVLLVIILSIFIKGYNSAKGKYEDEIAKLEEEIGKLSDPVAVHEIASKEVNIDVINVQIQDIGELATQEYLYTDAGKYSDPKQLWGMDVPFTTKSFIAKWDGSIKAGVKVDKITAEINEQIKRLLYIFQRLKFFLMR